eukprot:TRINITY_DN45017_c0_g1_i1.p1 TRINITY_DN45017_c0_g1~~TRINITY_DN45017_c0_g1_i1.p1  ORF type:complete len:787 (+),score=48.08 TRINITY_DN45017_c0_g1_i1:86-2446(+)
MAATGGPQLAQDPPGHPVPDEATLVRGAVVRLIKAMHNGTVHAWAEAELCPDVRGVVILPCAPPEHFLGRAEFLCHYNYKLIHLWGGPGTEVSWSIDEVEQLAPGRVCVRFRAKHPDSDSAGPATQLCGRARCDHCIMTLRGAHIAGIEVHHGWPDCGVVPVGSELIFLGRAMLHALADCGRLECEDVWCGSALAGECTQGAPGGYRDWLDSDVMCEYSTPMHGVGRSYGARAFVALHRELFSCTAAAAGCARSELVVTSDGTAVPVGACAVRGRFSLTSPGRLELANDSSLSITYEITLWGYAAVHIVVTAGAADDVPPPLLPPQPTRPRRGKGGYQSDGSDSPASPAAAAADPEAPCVAWSKAMWQRQHAAMHDGTFAAHVERYLTPDVRLSLAPEHCQMVKLLREWLRTEEAEGAFVDTGHGENTAITIVGRYPLLNLYNQWCAFYATPGTEMSFVYTAWDELDSDTARARIIAHWLPTDSNVPTGVELWYGVNQLRDGRIWRWTQRVSTHHADPERSPDAYLCAFADQVARHVLRVLDNSRGHLAEVLSALCSERCRWSVALGSSVAAGEGCSALALHCGHLRAEFARQLPSNAWPVWAARPSQIIPGPRRQVHMCGVVGITVPDSLLFRGQLLQHEWAVALTFLGALIDEVRVVGMGADMEPPSQFPPQPGSCSSAAPPAHHTECAPCAFDPSASSNASADTNPCTHNSWDSLRAKPTYRVLRCRDCTQQWRCEHDTLAARRCAAFDEGQCTLGSACPALHVHKRKLTTAERHSPCSGGGM